MNCLTVCVDFGDLLRLTLPYNRHHFDRVMIVTAHHDLETMQVAEQNNAELFVTDDFYSHGAAFNKWKPLEMGLDRLGRDGWLCLLDADVMIPKHVEWSFLAQGNLYTPRRRMMYDVTQQLPQEVYWRSFPRYKSEEFAGWCQIFHADDPALPSPPWHETNWRHAGGADTYFQRLWSNERKVRPPFEVLHLGENGKSWCGRATRRTDGTLPTESDARRATLKDMLRMRHVNRSHAAERTDHIPDVGKMVGN